MNIIEADNDKVIEYCDDFKNIYTAAKVRKTEVLCAKGLIVLPMFVPNATTESVLSNKIEPFVLSNDELKGTGYSNFEFAGLTLNAESHLSFWYYINALSQKIGASRITVSVRDMLPFLGKSNNDFSVYNKYFLEFLERIRHTRVKYTINSKLKTIDSSLIGTFEILGEGVYSINLGSFMVNTLLHDSYTHKVGIHKHENIAGGNARILKDKLDVMIYNSSGSITIDTLFAVLRLRKKTKAERDASFKSLLRAIRNLQDVGFIISVEDVKTGRSITAKKFIIDRNFDENRLDGMDDEFTVAEHNPTETRVTAPASEMLPLPNTSSIAAKLVSIEESFDKIGINPDALAAGFIIAETDPWNEIPDFKNWERDSDINKSKVTVKPRKVFEGPSYDEFYEEKENA